MKKYLLPFLFLLITTQTFAQDFKVIGYLPYYRFGFADQIAFEKLTHLNIAFANPDAQGNLDVGGQDVDPIVSIARANDLTIMLSLAGGALTAEWANNWANLIKAENRSAFIHKIMQYVALHDFDGLDVDLEWSHVDENYSPFVLELRDSVDAYGLAMTAAWPATTRYADITDEALAAMDYINMMVYDLTGSWAPNNPGPHSPYSFAISAINYWTGQGVPKEKLTLGVPFYGYDFTGGSVSSFTFRAMVEENPTYAQLDQVGLAYYNGIPTIQAKAELALEELSGIMIWELGQDAFNEYSLLGTIDGVINGTTPTTELAHLEGIQVYPNPFHESVQLFNENTTDVEWRLVDNMGRMLQQGELQQNNNLSLNTMALPKGFYFLVFNNGQGIFQKKLVKG